MEDDNKKPASTAYSKPEKTAFRQPWAVALVCLVFIAFFLITGRMNMQALDKALVGYMEKNCLIIVNALQQTTAELFHSLGTAQSGANDPVAGSLEESPSLEEEFISSLIDLIREMESRMEADGLRQEDLESFLSAEGLTVVAFLDDQGRLILSNRTVPAPIQLVAEPVILGTEIFRTNIFSTNPEQTQWRFIALSRNSGKGTVILMLDEDGFDFRRMKFCLETALREMFSTQDKAYAYLVVSDRRGRIMGRIGKEIKGGDKDVMVLEQSGLNARKIFSGGRHLLEISMPLLIENQQAGVVRLGLESEGIFRILSKNRQNILISMGVMILITMLSIWLLNRNQARYIKEMQVMEQKVNQAERLSALGRLAAGVAHEIRNPLNAISMGVQRIHKDAPHKLTQVIREEIGRLNRIISDFVGIAKTRNLELRPFSLRPILEQIIILAGEEAEVKGIKLQTRWPENDLISLVDRDKIKQAFINIISNAMESGRGPCTVKVSLEMKGKEWASVKIADTGTGLDPGEIRHIFDLDYTTKDKGLGLGLPLAHEIIKGLGGKILVSSQPGAGSVFEIVLPLCGK
ncbi:putative ATPase/histidine kinase/DNA gyrase B/HSP90 domain protein [uncultured Desulfobacterium sp.]|uniref:histidine kinase n=1 Tax=uncultured Desulfobacterium sp. TaxID=201089 RepID=A0A445MVV3_9BACT|nr:putative ATPase/histidine kinase/DNA gyrase B/HSP90 domain protein [uncultured Desulfobacterium sp.]